MKLYELLEARRNPDKNPRASINDIISDEYKERGKDQIAGTDNLFVSFTQIDKLGINPKSDYNTPLGIYSYPITYVIDQLGDKKATHKLPFAGDSPYINFFKARGNIINIYEIDIDEVEPYFDKIIKYVVEQSSLSPEDVNQRVQELIQDTDSFDYPGRKLWYVTRKVAAEILSSVWKTKTPIAWNKLFRGIGIDGVVDIYDTSGAGIIHKNEPTQAVFFSIEAVKDVRRHKNSILSASDIASRKEKGPARHEAIKRVSADLNRMSDVDDVKQYLDVTEYYYISLIKNQLLRSELLQKYPGLIKWIKNPTLDDQKAVLSVDYKNFVYIQNPNEQLFVEALKGKKLSYIQAEKLALEFPNAGEEMQEIIGSVGLSFLLDIPHLGEKMQLRIAAENPNILHNFKKTYPSVIKKALETHEINGTPQRAWLRNMAQRFGIPFMRIESPELKDERRLLAYLKDSEKEQISALEAEKAQWEEIIKSANSKEAAIYQRYADKDIADIVSKIKNIQSRIKETINNINMELNK